MCGRFALAVPRRLVAEAMGVPDLPEVPARPEIFPSQLIEAVYVDRDTGRRLAGLFEWGFVPAFAGRASHPIRPSINARAETVLDKPSFRAAARYRRCLIPAQGFYEWRKEPDGKKTRFFITLPDAPVMGLAGLYERSTTPDGIIHDTATILTRDASTVLADIHDRMPLIVPPDAYAAWLDPDLTDRRDIGKLLDAPSPALKLEPDVIPQEPPQDPA